MSNSLTGIKGRLSQLNQSISGGHGHSGGITIRKEMGNMQDWKDGLKLYVSVCPVICEVKKRTEHNLRLMGAVCYMEYEAFSMFMERNPTLKSPKFNTQ